jgi:hypothetical protein
MLIPDFEVHSSIASAAVTDTAGHESHLKDFVEAAREGTLPAIPASSPQNSYKDLRIASLRLS